MKPAPAFVPDKGKLWSRLEFIAKEDPEVAAVHAGDGDASIVQMVVYRWKAHLLDMSPRGADKRLVESILIEFCDPRRIAFPDALRYEDLLKQWKQGLFSPEPVSAE